MKVLKYILFCLAIGLWSCGEDDLSSTSNFTDETVTPNEFDQWLTTNYNVPYNLEFNYRYVDTESDTKYNLIPAKLDKAFALAKLIKYLWLDSYVEINETVNPSFMQTYCPKSIQLIGSAAYNDGSRTLGQAEGGLKITLYEVNGIDLNNVTLESVDEWFHTMHHEFTHILNQKKIYSTEYSQITPKDYNSSGWTNLSELEALHLGFISAYGSSEPNEDFVETTSLYLVHDQAWWDAKLALAEEEKVTQSVFDAYTGLDGVKQLRVVTNADGTTSNTYYIVYGGNLKITEKLNMVKKYFHDDWGFELEDLRTIIQRRSASINTLDLTSYN